MNHLFALFQSKPLYMVGLCTLMVLAGNVEAGDGLSGKNKTLLKQAKQAFRANELKRSIKLYDSARHFYKTQGNTDAFLKASYELLQHTLMLNYTPALKFDSVWAPFAKCANTYKNGRSIYKVRALHINARHKFNQATNKKAYQTPLKLNKKAEKKLKNLSKAYPADLVSIYVLYSDLLLTLEGGTKHYRRKAFELMKNKHIKDPEVLAMCYRKWGYQLGGINKRDSSIRVYQEGINILREYYPKYHLLFYDLFNGIGRQYLIKTKYNKAKPYFDTAYQVLKASNRLNSVKEGKLQLKFGFLADQKKRLHKVLTHYKRAIHLLEAKHSKKTTKLIRAYNALSSGYLRVRKIDKAKHLAQKANQLLKNKPSLPKFLPFKAMTFTTFGNINKKISNYQKAEEYYKKAIRAAKALPGEFFQMLSGINMNLSGNYIKQHKYDQAIKTVMNTKIYLKRSTNAKSSYIGNVIYHRLGNIYKKKGEMDSAFYYLQKATQLNTVNFNKDFRANNPALSKVINHFYQYNMTVLKSSLFHHLYKDNKNLALLQKALMNYRYASKCFDKALQNTITGKNSKIATQEFNLLSPALEVCYKLTQAHDHDNGKVLKQAYQFAEKTKGIAMSSAIAKYNLNAAKHISDSLTHKLKALNITINRLTDSIQNAKSAPSKSAYVNERMKVYRNKNQIFDTLKANYPEYFNRKFSHSTTPLRAVKAQLKKADKNIVEYVVEDSMAYALVITPETNKLVKLTINDTLKTDVKKFRKQLSKGSHQFYEQKAHRFYQYLFKPVEKYLTTNHVVVIPDGFIWYLPFDLMLKKMPEKENIRDYPFLVRQYAFSYAPSTTLWMHPIVSSAPPKSTKKEKEIAFSGYAPAFNNAGNQELASASRRSDTLRTALGDIPGAKKEVNVSSFDGKAQKFINQKATESQFKKTAPNSRIIHLATHGVINNQNPAYSKLLFANDTLNDEDNELHNYEIYNLGLDADLAVLSACRTGYGKLIEGEGLMSLARGFKIAGCNNILMTMWPVEDRSSAKLMQLFYKKLREGMPKAKALKQAKLTFLKKGNNVNANPYYWSGYVMMGSQHDIPEPQSSIAWYWWLTIALGGLLVLGIGSFYWIRRAR